MARRCMNFEVSTWSEVTIYSFFFKFYYYNYNILIYYYLLTFTDAKAALLTGIGILIFQHVVLTTFDDCLDSLKEWKERKRFGLDKSTSC